MVAIAPHHVDDGSAPARSSWAAVTCLSLLTFVLVASEFMPASLLTPIATSLSVSEGQAGQAIAISGLFAIVTSLFGNSLLTRLDRRAVVLLYTAVMIVSGAAVALAPNYLAFMVGRALIGVAVGGFWSLSTAILARVVSSADLPKAIAMLQGGTALATVVAAPLGSFLGGLVGWRVAFFLVVPVGLAGLFWQLAVLPRMPAQSSVNVRHMLGLLRQRLFAVGIVATVLAFMGFYALSTYLRPYLETVAGFDVNGLSLALFGLGLAGLAGNLVVGFLVRTHLRAALIGLPTTMGLLAVMMVALVEVPWSAAVLVVLWGLVATPIPVAWNTWMARVIPNDLEAGGGLQVALIQFAITFGAAAGGLLFDAAGWWSPFVLAAALLAGSALVAARSVPLGRS